MVLGGLGHCSRGVQAHFAGYVTSVAEYLHTADGGTILARLYLGSKPYDKHF